jgi:hypothetical protein
MRSSICCAALTSGESLRRRAVACGCGVGVRVGVGVGVAVVGVGVERGLAPVGGSEKRAAEEAGVRDFTHKFSLMK